jgi:hypothetical protein
MTTPDLERRLTDLLRDDAEGAMKDTDTRDKLTTLLTDGERRLQNRRRGAVAGLVAAAAAVAVAVAVGTGRGDTEGTEPVSVPDVDQVAVAESFLEATYAFDLDAAEALLSSDVMIGGDAAAVGAVNVKDWLAGLAWAEATGHSLADYSCATTTTSAAGTEVHCTYALNAFGSEELGRGPFEGNLLDVTIVADEITQIEDNWSYMTNGFNAQMWQPFKIWMREEHPRDAAAMYADASFTQPRTDARSLRLWEQRLAEWVASQE